jgi:hypothetical protein
MECEMQKEIKILNTTVKIEILDEIPEVITESIGDDVVGVWRSRHNSIQVLNEDELSNGSQFEVLCHEIVEAWNDKMAIELDHRCIDALGYALAQFLRENKLVDWKWE